MTERFSKDFYLGKAAWSDTINALFPELFCSVFSSHITSEIISLFVISVGRGPCWHSHLFSVLGDSWYLNKYFSCCFYPLPTHPQSAKYWFNVNLFHINSAHTGHSTPRYYINQKITFVWLLLEFKLKGCCKKGKIFFSFWSSHHAEDLRRRENASP